MKKNQTLLPLLWTWKEKHTIPTSMVLHKRKLGEDIVEGCDGWEWGQYLLRNRKFYSHGLICFRKKIWILPVTSEYKDIRCTWLWNFFFFVFYSYVIVNIRELGIDTLKLCEQEEIEMLKLAQTMFDTKLPPGVKMLQPFSEGSSIKKISVRVCC